VRPVQVLDCQADLLKRLQTDDRFRTYTTSGLAQAQIFGGLKPFDNDAHVANVYRELTKSVENASAYRVTDEMSMLVQFAALKLDSSDRIDRTLTPSDYGIVRFDRPLAIRDARSRTMLAHWMTWGKSFGTREDVFGRIVNASGLIFSWWNDTWDGPDEVQEMISLKYYGSQTNLNRLIGRWGFCGMEVCYDGMRLGDPELDLRPDYAARVIANGDTPSNFTNTLRIAHALFLLLNQTVTTVEEDVIPKAHRSRIARMEIPGRVSVIALRRHEGSRQHGETNVQWAHRWPVRGHWAWRHCGAEHPGAQEYEKGWRVRVWIPPYIKGPDGLPLVQTEKVYDLRR
jgi:hypothetical protein